MTPQDLRPYQHLMIDHIIEHKRCNLFVPMGMGKTVSTLTALDIVSLSDDDVYPTLVLAPLRVANSTWPAETANWTHLAHLSVIPITGSEKERMAATRLESAIYSINYENLSWLVEMWGDRWPYKTVVADECLRFKGYRLRQGSVRARSFSKVAHTKVKRYIGLTGSPAAGGLQDLWAIVWMVDVGKRLGRSFDAFKQRWFQKSFDGWSIKPLAHAQDEIQGAIKDVCLSLRVNDWFDLKAPIVTDLWVNLPIKARKHYAEMEKAMYTELEGQTIEAFGAAAKTQKCQQIASGFAYLEGGNKEWSILHDEKIKALDSIVEEASGMPVLVAYQFKADLDRLLKAFPKGKHLDKNPNTIKDFNAGKIPILFAHPASAGHGLNLAVGSNIMVYFSVDWNLEYHEQVLERIGPVRQAQANLNRNVFVYRILAKDTIDELVLERLDGKREVQDILLEAMKRRKK